MKDETKWKTAWDSTDSALVENYDRIHNIDLLRRSEMLSIIKEQSKFIDGKQKKILDLGAGTGAAAFAVLEEHSDAQAILIDGSLPMLQEAEKKSTERSYSIDFICQDLSDRKWVKKCNLKSDFPLIISSMMIHHLTDQDKKNIFREIYDLLLPSGLFIYCDVIKMDRVREEEYHMDLWVNDIINNKKVIGMNCDSFEMEKKRLLDGIGKQEDMPASIPLILEGLNEAGFTKTALLWFYIKFGIFVAVKD